MNFNKLALHMVKLFFICLEEIRTYILYLKNLTLSPTVGVLHQILQLISEVFYLQLKALKFLLRVRHKLLSGVLYLIEQIVFGHFDRLHQ